MSPRLQLRWIAVAVFAVASPGCLILPYGFPTIDRIAAMPVPSPSDDVHVFRVDGDVTQSESRGPCFGLATNVAEVRRLDRIGRFDDGTIGSQWSLNFEHGRVRVGILTNVPSRNHHTMAVCLYRPGYETIRIKGSDDRRTLEWKSIVGSTQRELAVDALLKPITNESSQGVPIYLPDGLDGTTTTARRLVRGLRPGSESPAHRKALLFCAAEYERIAEMVADDGPDGGAVRERLLEKSQGLRKLAGG